MSKHASQRTSMHPRNALNSAFSEQSKASYRLGRCRSLGWMRQRWRGHYG
jgi:hypothetical protein